MHYNSLVKGNDTGGYRRTQERVLTSTPIGHSERRMPDNCKRLDKLMRAHYRFAACSICLLLLQSIGSFCANTGFAQLAPAVVAAAQDLPSRAPALAVPNEVLIVFRHDAPQNVEDIARDYRLVHVESYSDSLLERTVHHFRISSGDGPVAGLPSRNRMRSTSPSSEQPRKKDDESSQEKADAARM